MGADIGAVDMTLLIRDATPGDLAQWQQLWQDYLVFYKVTLDAAITDHTWARLMSPDSRLKMRLALRDGRAVGFAIYHPHESTWVLGSDCYLEDLFVQSAVRGGGIGRALIDDLKVLATARGWRRLYWHTDHDNARARKLYDSYAPADGAIRYRINL